MSDRTGRAINPSKHQKTRVNGSIEIQASQESRLKPGRRRSKVPVVDHIQVTASVLGWENVPDPTNICVRNEGWVNRAIAVQANKMLDLSLVVGIERATE